MYQWIIIKEDLCWRRRGWVWNWGAMWGKTEEEEEETEHKLEEQRVILKHQLWFWLISSNNKMLQKKEKKRKCSNNKIQRWLQKPKIDDVLEFFFHLSIDLVSFFIFCLQSPRLWLWLWKKQSRNLIWQLHTFFVVADSYITNR